MPETKLLTVADLEIDEENPRLPSPANTQRDALHALASIGPDKMLNLAKDIVDSGGLDPSSLPIVMPNPNDETRYIVLEGNRRLCTLRGLENPTIFDGHLKAAELSKLRKLSKAYLKNPAEEILCYVVGERADANHWIELRHTPGHQGAGVVAWKPHEHSKFTKGDQRGPIHVQVLDWLQERGHLTTEERRKVPLSNLERLLGTPEVRARIGIEKDGPLMRIAGDSDEVAASLMHVVTDLVADLGEKNVKVDDIKTVDQRQRYAETIPREEKLPARKATGAAATKAAATDKSAGSSTKKKQKSPRQILIPGTCKLALTSGRLAEIEDELRKMRLASYPNAVAFAMRVFVELSADEYIVRHIIEGVSEDDTLNKKLTAVAQDLFDKKKLTKQQFNAVGRATSADSLLAPSTKLMHAYIHNQHVHVGQQDLRSSWDTMEPFMVACWSE